MADVADGRFRADAGPGAPFHRAGERNRPRLRPEALHGRDAPALWRAGPAACRPRIRRRRLVGCGLRHPRLGLAPPAPQGGAEGFSERRALVQRADGPAGDQARHGSHAGLSFSISTHCCRRPALCAIAHWDRAMTAVDLERARPHARFASNAILTASPVSTAPISQRCSNNHVGRVPRTRAIEPAASAIPALTLTLIMVWIEPSVSDCVSTLPTAGSINAPRPSYSRPARRPAAGATAAPRGTARPASRAVLPAALPPPRCRALRRSVRRAPATASAPRVSSRPARPPCGSWRGG